MATAAPPMIVVPLDREMVLYLTIATVGIVGFIVAALGEFVFGWWQSFGEWAAALSLALTVIGVLSAAGKFQVHGLHKDVRRTAVDAAEIKANTQRIEANTEGLPRIEAHTGGLPRIEANTQETVLLLREIRDVLRAPRS